MKTIYLADLTHTTITISNDSFPLNVGLVAAHAKVLFPQFDFKLFKFPDALFEAIKTKKPDLVGFSNYPWNHRLNLSFAKWIKATDPDCVTVLGGPYISYRRQDQEALMKANRDIVDFYAMFEGESSFAALLDAAVAHDFDPASIKAAGVKGSLYITPDGSLCAFEAIDRSRSLDDYPSPYLDGTLDEFFDLPLSPMMETHRGCPYSCTYCHEGHDFYNKIGRHSLDRMNAEANYVAAHANPRMSTLMFADPNFGIFTEHIELARTIRSAADRHGYPRIIFATTAKNSKDKLIEIGRQLGDIRMPIWMSVQSMTDDVLVNIKRRNISTKDMLAVQKTLALEGQATKSELILCLPGESFASHLSSIVELIAIGIDSIVCYQLMVLDGSELQESYCGDNQWGMVTRYRVLPRSFNKARETLEKSLEVERIVVATNDFSFPDYLEARKLHLLVNITYNGRAFSGFFRILREIDADLNVFLAVLLQRFGNHPRIGALLIDFIAETESELFGSEEALLAYYDDEGHFADLADGKAGANLIQKYTSLAYFDHSNDLVEVLAAAALESVVDDDGVCLMLADVARYYQLAFDGFLAPERRARLDQGDFSYDIPGWLAAPEALLADFRLPEPATIEFHTPEEQFTLVEDLFTSFGRGPQEFGKILTRIWVGDMLRTPRVTA
jgi:radical SAM superfamily enzyme YgiQ (UPF0313 family)